MTGRKEKIWLGILFSVTALFFLLYPIGSAFIKGVFHWHLTQPALWRDAIELLIYFVVMLVSAALAKNKKGIPIVLIGVVYLLSTGTFLQCAVSYVYVEVIICIGRSFLAVISKDKRDHSVGVNFLAGSMLWGGIAIVMSLLQAGTIEDLRILTVILLLLAVINPAGHMSIDDILLVRYVKYMNHNKGAEFWVNLFFVFVMLISCARVNTYIEHDSSLYALHTDKCLFGEHSFYDFLGYVDFVYYYPKFKELLMAPISGLGLAGYLIASNLWIMLLCVVEVYQYLAENVKGNRNLILSMVYLIFSSVCIVGISGTAKSDTISYLYLLLLIFYFMRYFQKREQSLLWIAFAAGVMSYTVKYTSFLFSSIVFGVIFATMLYLLVSKKLKLEKPKLSWVLFFAVACFIFLGIIYRTYKLTGYPTYREAKGLWDILGFQPNPYFDIDAKEKPESVFAPVRIFSVLFDVNNANKIAGQWTGNYSVFFGLCLLGLYRKRSQDQNKPLCWITVALVLASVWFLVTMASPDGNYFSVAIVTASCYVFLRMAASEYWMCYRKWFSVVVGLFMLLNLAFVFVTHPSWGTAARFSDDPVSIFVSEEEKIEDRDEYMKQLGIYEINECLKNTDGRNFIIADGESNMSMLNARVELAVFLFFGYASGAHLDDYDAFVDYVRYTGTDGFIVASDGSGNEPFDSYVDQYLSEYGCMEQVYTGKYEYYRIK